MLRYLSFLLFLSFFGCDSDDNTTVSNTIIGTWQLHSTKISPGGPVKDWTMVTNGHVFVFNVDSSYNLDKEQQCNNAAINGTFILNTNKLELVGGKCNGNLYEPSYSFELVDGYLILRLVGCIEECSFRYVRKK